ncbi:flagellar export protein FliJ [Nocardioides sp. YIM 152315]|uniref:flagellar export protein FliJ n=1 Tax=Nocardioides sp. YIM 152315 TaxID=3031760 RepID=UPI0023DB09C9|nr:flagellar export protein FliJ [Nocardioides sp. YIM 152315]MDF1605966.1 flagellar export protein FliJ [Nocardioides sp. YIM 152315]
MTTPASSRKGNLRGLVRLRTVRERDSRTGLATALAEERHAEAAISDLELMLSTLPAPTTSDLTAFQGRQQTLDLIRTALTTARADLESARVVSAAARDRWMADRTRLKAVESLAERRVAAIRAERERRERIELDEVAEEMWRRGALVDAGPGGRGAE